MVETRHYSEYCDACQSVVAVIRSSNTAVSEVLNQAANNKLIGSHLVLPGKM